jgi:hypothetical protein
MKSENVRELVKALQFYADPMSYLGAPAPVYSDSGRKAFTALRDFGNAGSDWWNTDMIGLSVLDVEQLRQRLGERLWDGVIHLGGINTGVWVPWPGKEGDCVRDVLRQYKNRDDFRKESVY